MLTHERHLLMLSITQKAVQTCHPDDAQLVPALWAGGATQLNRLIQRGAGQLTVSLTLSPTIITASLSGRRSDAHPVSLSSSSHQGQISGVSNTLSAT